MATSLINALPPGLLELVFRHFAHRNILSIVSRVCRHWRRAALRSIRHFSLNGGRLSDAVARPLLAQMTGLEYVLINSLTAPLAEPLTLPPSVTSLGLECVSAKTLESVVYPPLRVLRVPHVEDLDLLRAVLSRSRSSLTSLHLPSPFSEELFAFLASETLPALTKLTITCALARSVRSNARIATHFARPRWRHD